MDQKILAGRMTLPISVDLTRLEKISFYPVVLMESQDSSHLGSFAVDKEQLFQVVQRNQEGALVTVGQLSSTD